MLVKKKKKIVIYCRLERLPVKKDVALAWHLKLAPKKIETQLPFKVGKINL